MADLYLPGDLPGLLCGIPLRGEYLAPTRTGRSEWHDCVVVDGGILTELGDLLDPGAFPVRYPLAMPEVQWRVCLGWAPEQDQRWRVVARQSGGWDVQYRSYVGRRYDSWISEYHAADEASAEVMLRRRRRIHWLELLRLLVEPADRHRVEVDIQREVARLVLAREDWDDHHHQWAREVIDAR